MTAIEFKEQLVNSEEMLRNFARKFTLNPYDADDLLQDTYLKALVYKERFDNYSNQNIHGWLYTIMKNTHINNYHKNQRRSELRDNTSENAYINTLNNGLYNSTVSDNSLFDIQEKLDMLEPKFRIPLKLHTQGYKYKEIAKRLGLHLGTVKSRIYLSRKKMKETMN